MSKEKQIEEMAKMMADSDNKEVADALALFFVRLAEALYNAGYRKQSEWISVDERLPEEYEKCLVVAKVGDRTAIDLAERVRCYHLLTRSESLEWLITNDWDEGEGCEITHWMPLPEPPKMKGGAE